MSENNLFAYDPVAGASVLVIFLYVDSNNKVWTILTRSTGFNTPLWRIPGGHVDSGEGVEEAALREATEETGLTSIKLIYAPHLLVEKPPKGKLTSVMHKQFVFFGITNSLAGFLAGCVDGFKILTNEIFPIEELSSVVFNNGYLKGYQLMPTHAEILKKPLLSENFGIS